MKIFIIFAVLAAVASADDAPSSSYGVPDTPPGPYAAPAPAPEPAPAPAPEPAPAPAPSSSYGVPDTPPGPYAAPAPAPEPAPAPAPAPEPAPAPVSSYSVPATAPGPYAAPAPAPEPAPAPAPAPEPASAPVSSYSVPATAPGPYGGGSSSGSSSGGYGESVTHIPGQYVTSGFHNQYYAPLFRTVYVPVSTGYTAPAPSTGYGVPSPASSYGVPVTAPGPYGGGHAASSSYGPPQPQYAAQRQHIGNALVRNWLTQTLLHGGGRIIQRHYKDGYNGYKTHTVEEWDDQVPNYNYGYDITGPYGHEDTSATETRSGGQTSGRYTVKQPDGRTRIVEYTADENGYRPTVTYA